MDVQIIANWFTGFVEAYLLFVLCDTFMQRRETVSKYVYISGTILMGILINISNLLFSITILNMAVIVLLQFIVSFLYSGKLRMHLISSVLNFMLSCMSEVLIFLLLTAIFDISGSTVVAEGTYRLMGIALSKTLYYAIVKFISLKFDREVMNSDFNYWLLFVIMFSVTTLTMFTFFRVFAEIVSSQTRNLAIISCCGLGAETAIVLFLYERTMRQKYQIAQNQLSELKLKEQIKHYNDVMMTQGQVKKVKHDLKNHLFSIKAIVERKQYGECVEYINSLLKDINLTNTYADTGNVVIDAIIAAKKVEAQRAGIAFSSKNRIPANLPISQEDECVIFGNALDNAIEAAIKSDGEKYVNVSLVYDKETLMCKISNSAKDNSSVTTKNDTKNHGLGRDNINKALAKYNSVSRVTYEDNEYTLFFIIMGLVMNEQTFLDNLNSTV